MKLCGFSTLPEDQEANRGQFNKTFTVVIHEGPGKRGHIVAHDVSWTAKTGKHLLWTQNVSEQNQKHFFVSRTQICVRNKCCAHRQTGKHLCWQQ